MEKKALSDILESIQFWKKKPVSTGRVGLSIGEDQIALAYMETKNGAPYLEECRVVELSSMKEAGKELKNIVEELELEEKQASYVLNPRDYNLHLVEAPKVEPAEMRSAIRWKIKDLLDMKVEDAALDVFPVPEDAYRGTMDMVYVAASMKSKVQDIINLVNGSGLELAVIDIPELVMKNLSVSYLDDEQGIAFVDLRRTGSTMNITRNGSLYLTRRINTQLDPDVMDSFEWATLQERLVLELQRSLDYYESQMGQSPISKLYIAQRQYDTSNMVKTLNDSLSQEVSSLNLLDHLECGIDLTSVLQQSCMGPIGATLRGARKAQAEESEQEAA